MKRILIILLLAVVAFPAFAQMGSNSHTLAEQFAEGAKSAGNELKINTKIGTFLNRAELSKSLIIN